MKYPKVLIFTAVYDKKHYALPEFVENSKKINYPNYKHIYVDNSKGVDYTKQLVSMGLEAYHVERGNNTREALARSQNFARQKAIEGGYDYMFSLESDVFVPHDIIQRLMLHCKDVVSGWYWIGNLKTGFKVPCITLPEYNDTIKAYGTRLLKPEEFPQFDHKGLQQVQAGSFGCCLIYKNVFKRFPFTYDTRFSGHSDIYFYNDLWMNRIPVFVDTDINCEHRQSDWGEVKDR